MALRSLGYCVRLASGFYVRPDAVDPSTGQTPVYADDVHCWPEVRLITGAWVPLEPTPGYTQLGPRNGMFSSLMARFRGIINFVARHNRVTVGLAVFFTLSWLGRRRIVETVDAFVWRVMPRRGVQEVRATAALIERRARRWDHSRPINRTRSAWFAELSRHAGPDHECPAFVQLLNWADYGDATPMPAIDSSAVCRIAAESFDAKAFERIHHLPPKRREEGLWP